MTERDSRPLKLRVFQLQKDVDPSSMGIRWDEFRDAPLTAPVPARLKPYLSDPQQVDYPIVHTFEVTPGISGAQRSEMPRHKSTSHLLVVSLGDRSGHYSMPHFRVLPVRSSTTICIDHFDAFAGCSELELELSSSRCPSPVQENCNYGARLAIYQLTEAAVGLPQQVADRQHGARPLALLEKEPEWLQRLLVNPGDPGVRRVVHLPPERRRRVRLRVVTSAGIEHKTRYLLLVPIANDGTALPGRVVSVLEQRFCLDRDRLFSEPESGSDFCRGAIEDEEVR